MTRYVDEISENGFAIVPDVINSEMILQLRQALAGVSSRNTSGRESSYGVRNLLYVVPAFRSLETHESVRALVDPIEGENASIVRSIFFDKTQQANWKVSWHQDLTIAVRHKVEMPGFTAWSVKAGIAHVQPPAAVLERVLTIRLHLDHTDEANGALVVLPGTHRLGRLGADQISSLRENVSKVICRVQAGGALIMRPLLLHSSSSGSLPSRRRVIHLDFSAEELPGGLEWYRVGGEPA
ncbi:MAG TPA: phytanoyl-CoA dioxygenase family protein [Blastocatellia bacterium]|nr:phytanoyl-CoA dioxygenase family protein [Blastocatellia bacterium]